MFNNQFAQTLRLPKLSSGCTKVHTKVCCLVSMSLLDVNLTMFKLCAAVMLGSVIKLVLVVGNVSRFELTV